LKAVKVSTTMMNTYALLVLGLLSGGANILAVKATSTEQNVTDEVGAATRKVSVYNHMLPEKNTWHIKKGGRQVTGCKGGPYSQWYVNAPTSCRLPAGSYTVTCCDTRTKQGWSGGYITVLGTKHKLCKKFTFGAKKKCYTQNFRVARIPTPRPTPKPTPPMGKIEQLAKCLQHSATNIARLPGVYKFQHKIDGISGNMIGDGGNDMYDSGNRLYIRYGSHKYVGPLTYTQRCDGRFQGINGAGNIKYFTCLHKIRSGSVQGDVFFAAFKSANKQITGFYVGGNTGADNVDPGSFIDAEERPHKWPHGRMWAYRKTIGPGPKGQKDPTINHLILIPKKNWAHYWPKNNNNRGGIYTFGKDNRRRRVYTTDPDYHQVEGSPSTGVSQLLYVLWGGWRKGQNPPRYRYNSGEIRKAIAGIKSTCR